MLYGYVIDVIRIRGQTYNLLLVRMATGAIAKLYVCSQICIKSLLKVGKGIG